MCIIFQESQWDFKIRISSELVIAQDADMDRKTWKPQAVFIPMGFPMGFSMGKIHGIQMLIIHLRKKSWYIRIKASVRCVGNPPKQQTKISWENPCENGGCSGLPCLTQEGNMIQHDWSNTNRESNRQKHRGVEESMRETLVNPSPITSERWNLGGYHFLQRHEAKKLVRSRCTHHQMVSHFKSDDVI